VAILKSSKEVDHMFTIKVENIDPKITTPEKLYDEFIKFGPIGDVYIRNIFQII
jgi:RNA recognition motif-containing protein